MVRVSNGIEAFILGNPNDIDFSEFKEGEEIDAVVHVSPFMGGLRGDIVEVS